MVECLNRYASGHHPRRWHPDRCLMITLRPWCFTMLQHAPAPNRRDQLFAGAYRVPQPGGVLPAATVCQSAASPTHADTYTDRPGVDLPVGCELWDSLISTADVAGARLRWRATKPVAV